MALIMVFFLALLLPIPAAAQEKPLSLYQRLGGYDAVAALVDDWLGRMRNDPAFTKFGIGYSRDSMKRRRQLTVDYFCRASGGPCFYTGRDMKLGHAGLGITGSEWQAAMQHLAAALDKFKVATREKGEVLQLISGLKTEIVEKSGD
jgi:hemoglobin